MCICKNLFELVNLLFCNHISRTRKAKAASGRLFLNRAITRGASGLTFFTQPCPSYMQSFIKIGVLVLEKSADKTMTLCNFNKDLTWFYLQMNCKVKSYFFLIWGWRGEQRKNDACLIAVKKFISIFWNVSNELFLTSN